MSPDSVCCHTLLSLHDLLSVCATQFCPTVNQGAKSNAFLGLHKNPLVPRPLHLVTSLKVEGFGEESHHRLAAFCFPFTCQHTRSLPESSRTGQRVLQKHRFAEVTPLHVTWSRCRPRFTFDSFSSAGPLPRAHWRGLTAPFVWHRPCREF